jgi:predicted  nucleic acid-binding Zn-ribbon protein
LENQIEKLPREKLQELDSISSELEFAERRISSFEEELADFEKESKHYEWLSQAVDWYERRGVESGAKPNRGLLIGAGISAILAILFIVLQVPIAAIAFVLIAAGSGLFYWRQMERSMELAVDADEMKKLSAEFEKRFDQPLTGLPQMRELKESMDEAYIGAERRRKDLEKEVSERDGLVERLGSLFRQLTGEMPEKELWPDAIREVNARHSSLQEQLVALKEKRARLDIAEDDYREKPTAVEYDQTALQDLIRELEVTEDRLEDEESKLGNLKQNIRAQTRDEYSADWELVIQNLQERRKGVANEYREITAEIIAGMLVNDVLEDNRAQEKEKIGERLSSPEVKNAISSITGRYKDVRYEEEQVLIEDEFGSFKLSELSTGAREQVLLGLRMGFAEQIFKQRELFLLLDDAFQHADWSRRKRLVDQSVALAKKGWQIIYFTMDDHIRDLFDEAGHKHFPDSYRHHDLNVPNTAITPGE